MTRKEKLDLFAQQFREDCERITREFRESTVKQLLKPQPVVKAHETPDLETDL